LIRFSIEVINLSSNNIKNNCTKQKDIKKDLKEEDLKNLEIIKNTMLEAVKQSENIVKK